MLLRDLSKLKTAREIKNSLLERKYRAASLIFNISLDEMNEMVEECKADQKNFFANESVSLPDRNHSQEVPKKILDYLKEQLHCIGINPSKIEIKACNAHTGICLRQRTDRDDLTGIMSEIRLERYILNVLNFEQARYIIDHELMHVKENDMAINRLIARAIWLVDKPYDKHGVHISNFSHLSEYVADIFPILDDSQKAERVISAINWHIDNTTTVNRKPTKTHPSWEDRKKLAEFVKQTLESN